MKTNRINISSRQLLSKSVLFALITAMATLAGTGVADARRLSGSDKKKIRKHIKHEQRDREKRRDYVQKRRAVRGIVRLANYRRVKYGGYNYYLSGGVYYYSYFHHGRTVYIRMPLDSRGNPLAPYSANSINISF